MNDSTRMDPDMAREQLDRAGTLARTAAADSRLNAGMSVAVGVLVALVLAGTRAFAGTNAAAFTVVFLAYAVLLTATIVVYKVRLRVSDSAFKRRYVTGLLLTTALYVVGVLWTSAADPKPSWLVFAPFCVLVAAPMVVAAVRMVRE